MEEVCDVLCIPLFGETGIVSYNVRGYDRTVTSKTRNRPTCSVGDSAADGLYADNLWPGCYVLADILVECEWLCKGKCVLELGAGSALPSLVASVVGAQRVVTTDYPEPSVMENIDSLIYTNRLDNAVSCSHRWGDSVEPLLKLIEKVEIPDQSQPPGPAKYDVILCAELLWRDTYSQHGKLLQSITQCLREDGGVAIVTFVHRPTSEHRPAHDLEFFHQAEQRYGLHSRHLGVVRGYRDCLEDSDAGEAEVQVFLLYYTPEVAGRIVI